MTVVEKWRDRRIRRRADFLRIQGGARRVSAPHFILLVAAQVGAAGPSRIGLVVTTKVGNAAERNRIKRVCRECFRQWKDLLPEGVDLVVIARRGAQLLGLADVQAEWARVHAQLRKRAEEALANRSRTTHLGPGPTAPPKVPGARGGPPDSGAAAISPKKHQKNAL